MSTRIIESRYPNARCALCGGEILRGEYVVFFPDAPRGQRVAHPECEGGLTPGLRRQYAAVRAHLRARAELREVSVGDAEAHRKAAEEEGKARSEAIRVISHWLLDRIEDDPDFRRTLRSKIDEAEVPKAKVIPLRLVDRSG